jgi:MinD superfamily P-loop ATPase
MIISIASGKGGTGKTLVATNMALSIGDEEHVQLIDCDVEEPNAHIFIKGDPYHEEKVCIPVPEVNYERCTYCGKCANVCAYNAIALLGDKLLVFPELCHGCGACSYLCPEKAIIEVDREIGVVQTGKADGIEFVQGKLNIGEPMATPIIKKAKEHIRNDGVVVLDVPPGTSCPVIESINESDFCVLVTEPTPFGLNDLTLAVDVTRKLQIPCGVIINRAGPDNDTIIKYCEKESIPVLLTIPLDSEIAKLYSKGIPLIEGKPEWKAGFMELYRTIKRYADGKNNKEE